MGLNIDDQVLMGMGIESVRIQEGNFEILTPGACVMLQADGILSIRQRIGADLSDQERKLLSCCLPAHLAPWRLAQWDQLSVSICPLRATKWKRG